MNKRAPSDVSKYRTPPDQPMDFKGLMYERVKDGKPHFFGFIGTQKYLMFPDPEGRTSQGGDKIWRLFIQELHPREPAEPNAAPLQPGDPSPRPPLRRVPAPAPPERLGFVSGLPDNWPPRARG